MRKLILFFTFLILTLIGYNQNYIPLVDTNSVWNITWNCYKPPPYPCYSDYYKYRISGDTIYNDTLYQRLYRIDMSVYCSSIIQDSIFIGGIREDVSSKKIYFIENTSWGEYLLYDFKLEIGDTVPITYHNYGYPELYVSSIDSVLCTDGYRKRFFYSRDTWADIEVIEGIGAYTGLIEPMEIFEHIPNMRCFYQSDTMIYMNPSVNSCNLEMDTCISTDINEQNIQKETIRLYPNPVYKQATVHILNPREDIKDYTLKIFDVNGTIKLNKAFTSNKISIENQNYIPGVFFYVISFKDQKIYSNILIIK